MSAPSLAIIVPACNEAAVIGPCLSALLRQENVSAPVEVVVAANACTDGTAAAASGYVEAFAQRGWRLDVLDLPEGGKTRAFNAAEARVAAPCRLFLDADVICAPDMAAKLLAVLDRSEPVFASGVLTIPRPRSWWSRRYARAWLRGAFASRTVPGSGLFAVNAAGRARWGSFPDTFADDLYVRLLFAPSERRMVDASFSWPVPEGLNALVRTHRRRHGHNRALLAARPELARHEDKGSLLASATRMARANPLDFAVYALVAGCAKAAAPSRRDYRPPRRAPKAPA